MAANFWDSTQRRNWQFTKDQLATMRQRIDDDDPTLVHMFPLPPLRHLNIYFNQQINRLGKRLGIRQQAMATAQVYIKRFYSKVEMRRTNPYLIIATSVYLACKTEECPQHIRMLTQEARHLWPDFHSLDTSKVGECEFFLISEMSSQLIIHQPYRTLSNLQAEFPLSSEESALAWSVINDHFMTDLPLLYPPHVIALTAILLALVLRPSNSSGGNQLGSPGVGQPSPSHGIDAAAAALAQAQAHSQARMQGQSTPGVRTPGFDAVAPPASEGLAAKDNMQVPRISKVQRLAVWLAESTVDIEAMVDCTQELISFYECHEQYNDKITREQINRFVKARGLDK